MVLRTCLGLTSSRQMVLVLSVWSLYAFFSGLAMMDQDINFELWGLLQNRLLDFNLSAASYLGH